MNNEFDKRPRSWRRLFNLGSANQISGDIADEVQFHLDSRMAELRDNGMSATEAQRVAEAEYGDLNASKQELTAIDLRALTRRSRMEWLAGWQQDLKLALRGLRRRPAYSTIVVATLALGIGATTSVFSLANATLLRPLPYRDAERLVYVWESRTDDAAQQGRTSYLNLEDLRTGNLSFSSLDGYDEANLTLTSASETSRIRGVRVTPGFLQTLGVTLARGRDLSPIDVEQGAVVVITDAFWRTRLSASLDVIGNVITLDGAPHTVIGVLPRNFHFAPTQDAEVWLPLQSNVVRSDTHGSHWLTIVGRMRDGVTSVSVHQDVAAIMRRLAVEYPKSNAGRTVTIQSLQDVVAGDVKPLLQLLFSAAAFVLLIACANVAGLLIARSLSRSQEIAVRGALGASRARMARTLLTESLLLSALGGALGLVFAMLGVRLLVYAVPDAMRQSMPTLNDAHVDGAVLFVSAVTAIACGVGAGVLPALKAGRQDIATLIRQGGRNLSVGGGRSRTVLIVAEIALTMVLLVGTGLLGRSMLNLLNTNFGFDASHVLSARIALAGDAYATGVSQQRYFEQLLARVQNIPGVQFAGAVSSPPFNDGRRIQFRVEGESEPSSANRPEALVRGVAGEYFEALRIPVIQGRTLASTDDSARSPVVVINASLAKQLFGAQSAIGKQIRFYAADTRSWTIVGVVADVKIAALDQPAPPTIYNTHLQLAENRMSVVLRGSGDPAQLASTVRTEARAMDPQLPVYEVETMVDRIRRMPEVSSRRFPLVLIGAFSTAALLLAAVGIYGLISHVVSQRTREFGIRRALGAGKAEVMSIVLRHAGMLVLSGVVVGGAAAMVLTQFVQSRLYGVATLDVTTYAGVVIVMLAFAFVASVLPARRAARVDPMVAMRGED